MKLEVSPRKTEMSDTHHAAELLDDVIGVRGVREPIKSMLERAYRALSQHNQLWTRRRVRAIWNREAPRIDHREIVEMQAVIAARNAHGKFRAETARLAAVHFGWPQDSMGDRGAHAGCLACGVDRAGNQGAEGVTAKIGAGR